MKLQMLKRRNLQRREAQVSLAEISSKVEDIKGRMKMRKTVRIGILASSEKLWRMEQKKGRVSSLVLAILKSMNQTVEMKVQRSKRMFRSGHTFSNGTVMACLSITDILYS
jgi:hypothetical protein